jgi:DNA-binding MurR/RpiR family transcriptional regulator
VYFVREETRVALPGMIERLELNVDVLAESEAKIGRWILDHPQEVITLTVRELASRAQSSQAAVVRLCRSLQIDGFNTLKVLLTADLVRNEATHGREYPELDPQASFEMRLEGFSQSLQTSIQSTINGIQLDQLQVVAEWMKEASHVLLFGVAASHVVAEDLYHKLLRLGYQVTNPTDFHIALMTVALFQPADLVFLVSFSGATDEVVEVARLAKQRGTRVVGISQFRKKSPLADAADLMFYVSAKEPVPRIGATSSVIASMVIGDALSLYLANREPEKTYRYLKDTEAAVQNHRLVQS